MGSLGPLELIIILLFVLAGPVLYVLSIVWAYRDAERRQSNGILAAILVAVAAWPLSLLIWVLVRPKDGA